MDGILHPANLQCGTFLWDYDIKFVRWQHPAMWHVALGSWRWIRHVAVSCNVARRCGITWHWIREVAAPCNDTWLWDHDIEFPHSPYWNILPVSISQSTCHSAPVCEILSKSDCPRHKKTSCIGSVPKRLRGGRCYVLLKVFLSLEVTQGHSNL